MSILLSLYTKDGIIFAADKNLTYVYEKEQIVFEGECTKVLMWPNRRAVIGVIGLGELENLRMDEWLRIFIAETRDFESVQEISQALYSRVQSAYKNSLVLMSKKPGVMFHIGGFQHVNEIATPVMYTVTNIPGLTESGGYQDANTEFAVKEELQNIVEKNCSFPEEVREYLKQLEVQKSEALWFNNGFGYVRFNVFKEALRIGFDVVRNLFNEESAAPYNLFDWEIYAKMAVELYGSYYKHGYTANERVVGGGVDVCSIPWPNS